MRKTITTIAVIAALAAGLSACATAEKGEPDSATKDAASQAAENVDADPLDAEEAETEEPAPEPTPEDDGLSKFGETTTYEDGLAITVSKPHEFHPSEWASKREKDTYFVAFTVTVKNGTAKVHNVSDGYSTGQTGQREAEEVYSTEQDVSGFPDMRLLPGRTAKFQIAYGADKGKEFLLAISPDWDHEDTLYTS